MTDDRPLRGPDFLPYDLPEPPVAHVPPPPPGEPDQGRWERALEGVPFLGIVSLGAGCAAFVLLVLLSWLADKPGPGAVVVCLAAAVSVVTGIIAGGPQLPKDSRTLIGVGQGIGVGSAVIALIVWVAAPDSSAQTVSPPAPQPTSSAAPLQPAQPTPTPSVTAGPGETNGFGQPSTPDNSLSLAPTDLGTLYGHVVDTAGKPVAGATITITRTKARDVSSTPDCATRVITQADKNGVYRQQLCQLGEGLGYTVTISVPGAKVAKGLFINAGQTTVYDVILPLRHG